MRAGCARAAKAPLAMRPDSLKPGLMVAVLVTALDQLSKWMILEIVMQPPRIIPVTPFFNLVLVWNRGVSFGFLGQQSSEWLPWLLTALALAIVVALVWWLRRVTNGLMVLAISLVVGGALGNVVDRLRFGAVVDFLDFHATGVHWPAFNAADSAITVGAAIILYDAIFADHTS